MKRDMNLARRIVLALGATDQQLDSTALHFAGYSRENIIEHLRLLHEAGLVEGVKAYSIEFRLKWVDLRLTRHGCEFFHAARSEDVWTTTMTEVRDKIDAAAFEVLKCLLLESTYYMLQPGEQPTLSDTLHYAGARAPADYAVTVDAAYQLQMDHEIGSIEMGDLAGFAVPEECPPGVAPRKIKDDGNWGTVVGGMKVAAPYGK